MFAPCPSTPNCVSTESQRKRQGLATFQLKAGHASAWTEIRAAILSLPRTTLKENGQRYLRAECRSRAFGFVDDLEVELRPDKGVLAVRSAARVGYYDFGVNRSRAEKLRGLLRKRGLIF